MGATSAGSTLWPDRRSAQSKRDLVPAWILLLMRWKKPGFFSPVSSPPAFCSPGFFLLQGHSCAPPAGVETVGTLLSTAPCWTVWTSSWAAMVGSKPPGPK